MSDQEKQIQADLACGQICLERDKEGKSYLQLKTENFFYGIVDVFAEKSSAPQFICQKNGEYHPMTLMEYRLFIQKLKDEISKGYDFFIKLYRIQDELNRLDKEYKRAIKTNHLCLRDVRGFSEIYHYSIDMYKNDSWYTASLGKLPENDIFKVKDRPMTGCEFIELFQMAGMIIEKSGFKRVSLDLFEDRFIEAGCKKIAEQRKQNSGESDIHQKE